jgi:hypothetical protein
MELVPLKTVQGERKAWKTLASMNPKDVCFNASAGYDAALQEYSLKSFGIEFHVSVRDCAITSTDPRSALFFGTLKDFFRLSLFWYLTSAKSIPSTGRLIRPVDVKGGHRFFTGTHVLPLDRIQEIYGRDKAAFINRGTEFGAVPAGFGDAALRFHPLPRVPVTMILWLADDEFPARAGLFFDSTIDYQISLSDIVWSVAAMTTLVMLV